MFAGDAADFRRPGPVRCQEWGRQRGGLGGSRSSQGFSRSFWAARGQAAGPRGRGGKPRKARAMALDREEVVPIAVDDNLADRFLGKDRFVGNSDAIY